MGKNSPKRRLAEEKRRQEQRKRWVQVAVLAGLVVVVGIVLAVKFRGPSAAAPGVATALPNSTSLPAGTPEEQLDQLLAARQPVLAFFHSNNCKQCIRMIEIVGQVYPEFEGSVALVDINVYDPQNERLLQEAKIQFIPTQVFYDRTGRSQTITGVMEPEQLRQQLQAIGGGQ